MSSQMSTAMIGRALLGQTHRVRPPLAPARPRDERDLAVEQSHSLSSPRSCPRWRARRTYLAERPAPIPLSTTTSATACRNRRSRSARQQIGRPGSRPASGILHDDRQHDAGVDLLAGATRTSVTVPSRGARMTCSIFIASSTSNGSPARTDCPGAVWTRTTLPGMGASSDPAEAATRGRGNRGTSRTPTTPGLLSM